MAAATFFRERLRGHGVTLKTGPFSFRIRSPIGSVADGLSTLYPDYPVPGRDEFIDYKVDIVLARGLRRWFRRQALFQYDGMEPFMPMPRDHAFPLLEWAMNWCISTQAHHYLLLHSAVIERGGLAAILPAPPGSGKSTLCAALIHRGWRLLSDELALISLTDGSITPLGRPVSLKNQSVELIRRFEPSAMFSRITTDTFKGTVAHMRVPGDQVRRLDIPATPRWVIFPRYVADADPALTHRSKANSMLELGRNSFNYMVLGLAGFETLSKVISASDCFDFRYSRLDDAVKVFDDLASRSGA